jgi:hypothetical protein
MASNRHFGTDEKIATNLHSAFNSIYTNGSGLSNIDTFSHSSPPAFEAMNVDPRLIPSSSGVDFPTTNAFTDFSDNSNMWSQHSIDFSSFDGVSDQNRWPWQQNVPQPQGFDMRHGLTTPLSTPPKDEDGTPSTSQRGDVISSTTTATKKRNSRKMSGGGGGGENQSAGRKPRKNSKPTTEMEEFEEGISEDKRERFLERNRLAASKCRQKKKTWTNNLEQRARELASERQMLATHVAVLRNELLELKCKCLEHTSCECEQIREYLKNTITTMPPANPSMYQLSDGSMHRSSISSASQGNNAHFSFAASGSSRSSVSHDSAFDYLKLEDDVRGSFPQAKSKGGGGECSEN